MMLKPLETPLPSRFNLRNTSTRLLCSRKHMRTSGIYNTQPTLLNQFPVSVWLQATTPAKHGPVRANEKLMSPALGRGMFIGVPQEMDANLLEYSLPLPI